MAEVHTKRSNSGALLETQQDHYGVHLCRKQLFVPVCRVVPPAHMCCAACTGYALTPHKCQTHSSDAQRGCSAVGYMHTPEYRRTGVNAGGTRMFRQFGASKNALRQPTARTRQCARLSEE